LRDFDEKTKDSNIVPRIRKHLLKMARYVSITKCKGSRYMKVFRKHAKVDEAGLKSKPAELSHDDIETAKKEWESIVLSEGEDES
jgi:hypothetical protein